MTLAEYLAEGQRRFGPDKMKWKFICPICKVLISVQDYKDAGAGEGDIGVSCIGRYGGRAVREALDIFGQTGKAIGPGPCNYSGYGLFHLNPVHISDHEGVQFFEFASADVLSGAQ